MEDELRGAQCESGYVNETVAAASASREIHSRTPNYRRMLPPIRG